MLAKVKQVWQKYGLQDASDKKKIHGKNITFVGQLPTLSQYYISYVIVNEAINYKMT